jgi:hypothetical protein
LRRLAFLRCAFIALAMLAMCAHAGTVITADGVMHEGEITLDHGITVRGSPTRIRSSSPASCS